jgi:phosphoribosylformimino-5-aminoimidazole carboxamide ribonucleotide (ProFAR) isomerase
VIRKMVKAVGDDLPVQLGGGIRDLDTIERYIDDGVAFVVIGTAAVKNPGFLHDACSAFAGHVIVALDARGGKVATDGWSKLTGHDVNRPGQEVRGLRGRGHPVHRHRPRRHDDRRERRGHGRAGARTSRSR